MTSKNTDKSYILGVGISNFSQKTALKTVSQRLTTIRQLADGRPFFIATPNPEMLVLAQTDAKFKQILNSADIALPDGVGLVIASKFLNLTNNLILNTKYKVPSIKSQVLSFRISGVDFMLDLCKLASQKGYTVGLLGAKEGVAQKTADELKKKFPGIKIKFAVSEISQLSLRGRIRQLAETDEAIYKTNENRLPRSSLSLGARNDPSTTLSVNSSTSLRVDLLFVAFGAPKQEKFIWDLMNYSSSQVRLGEKLLKDSSRRASRFSNNKIDIGVAMSVGGSFDFISGRVRRAPGFVQAIGFEWLWRLIQEPQRFKRIWNATVVFPWLLLKSLFKPTNQLTN